MLHGTARTGMDWFGLAGQVKARFYSDRQCLDWLGPVVFGLERSGNALFGMARRCEVRTGLVAYGAARFCFTRPGSASRGSAMFGAARWPE